MKNKQILYLFFCNFAVFLTGGALLPLLPLYATELGGTPTVVGIYLAVMYFAIATGTMLPGWLAGRVSRKGLFLTAGVVGWPALALHTQAASLWQIIPLTTIVWFCCGIGTALASVFIGVHANTQHRGRSFGLMFLARPLAGVIGGLTAGQIVVWWGYPTLFATLAVVWSGWPVIGPLILKTESKTVSVTAAAPAKSKASWRLGKTFYVLIFAAFLSTTIIYVGRLGAALSMQQLDFSPQAVTATNAVGYLVIIPVTMFIGVWSDRLGRKGILVLCYLLAAGGTLMLSTANQFWQFGLAMTLLLVVISANGSVAAAFATDLLEPANLSRGLSWLNAMTWLGGMAGFAGAGYALDAVGVTTLYLFAAILAIIAAWLLWFSDRPWIIWLNTFPKKDTRVIPAPKEI